MCAYTCVHRVFFTLSFFFLFFFASSSSSSSQHQFLSFFSKGGDQIHYHQLSSWLIRVLGILIWKERKFLLELIWMFLWMITRILLMIVELELLFPLLSMICCFYAIAACVMRDQHGWVIGCVEASWWCRWLGSNMTRIESEPINEYESIGES